MSQISLNIDQNSQISNSSNDIDVGGNDILNNETMKGVNEQTDLKNIEKMKAG